MDIKGKIRIGFDAKRAAQNGTGLGNYSRFVIDSLIDRYPNNDYLLYIPNSKKSPHLNEITNADKAEKHCPHTPFTRLCSALWRIWHITDDIEHENLDIFHGLSNELPLNIAKSKCLKIVTIHDLIFKHCKQYYHQIDRWIYDQKFYRACRNADVVVAVSEFTKQEIIHYYGIAPEKIKVVYQGCNESFRQPADKTLMEEARRKYSLPDNFVLYVGSIEERKNLMLIAKALNSMVAKDAKVVVVGKKTPYTDKVKQYLKDHDLESRVLFFHNVTYNYLPSFYHMARVFVYPSRIEGFGIPMLEALCCGVPAIGCKGSCLEEAGGPHSIYVDPDDHKGMANAIDMIWTDEKKRREMINRGHEYEQLFTRELLTDKLMDVYKDALKTKQEMFC